MLKKELIQAKKDLKKKKSSVLDLKGKEGIFDGLSEEKIRQQKRILKGIHRI